MTFPTRDTEETAPGRVRRLALLVEYDGTAYHGFQSQKNAVSVQNTLEDALFRLTGERRRIKGAGRTDAGVHALGQVVSFDTGSSHATDVFVKAMNHYLPEDVSVKGATEVEPDFDPRRWATGREYRYTILESDAPSPMLRGFAHRVARRLDVSTMQSAAVLLEGERDLAPFSGPLTKGRTSTVRRVYRCSVERRAGLVTLEMAASGFLPQQVRRTAGALIDVGLGRVSVRRFQKLADDGVPGAANRVAPAKGLSLVSVSYPVPLFSREATEASAFDRFLQDVLVLSGHAAHPEPVEGNERGQLRSQNRPLIWFDRLTMSGQGVALQPALALPTRIENESEAYCLGGSGYDIFPKHPIATGMSG